MVDIRKIRKRGRVIIAFIVLVGVVFMSRAAQVQIFQHGKFAAYAASQQQSAMPLKARRGSIYDCQGKLLAYDVEARTYTVNPRYMTDKKKAAKLIARLTGKSESHWLKEFEKHPGFLTVAPKVPENRQSGFEKSGIETLRFRSENIRIYPYDDLAAEVIGRTNIENKGAFGLEMYYDDMLSGTDGNSVYLHDAKGNEVASWEHTIVEPVNGFDLHLALDIDFQQIVVDELRSMLDSSRALWGTAIFLDVESGSILGCATVESTAPAFPLCRSIVDMNEPGSTAKIMPLVTVFQARIFEPDDIINVEGGRFNIGHRVIRDDHPHDFLRCDEVGIYSSNIGVSKMGIKAGSELIYRTLVQFGFGTRSGVDFPGERQGVLWKPDKWSNHLLANICFGYGVSVTGIQMAAAYGVIASGGDLKKPYFASKAVAPDGTERILNSKQVVRRALDYNTISIIHGILCSVVQKGTATKAKDEYSLIAGKTGTALRIKKEGRGYDPRRALASFAGYFPAAAPRVVGIIMFDEPKTSIYGGDISAPVFKRIAKRYSSLPRNYMMLNSLEAIEDTTNLDDGDNSENENILPVSIDSQEESGIAEALDDSVLPDFKGITIREAIRKARELGLSCDVVGSGIVLSQNPAVGVPLTEITTIELIGGQ